ncbi:MAG: hypothetical protein HYU74_02600 [Dechloromonas sp.]|nr:hypothetical protein [Dechloromonas sp.]
MNRRLVPPSLISQRGVSIIAAIFFLLLFAAIAAAMVSLTTTSNATSSLDIQGERAYQAARGGAEWGLWQVLNNPANGAPINANAPLPNCFASPANLAAIPGFAVDVTCQLITTQEGARNVGVFRIVSTANSPAPGIGVSRQIVVTAEVCRDTLSTVAPFNC